MEFINQMQGTLFTASVFTDVLEYLSFAAGHEVDILLCSEEHLDSIISSKIQDTIFILSTTDSAEAGDYRSIYKYQSAVSIYNMILNLYGGSNQRNKAVAVCENVEIYGIIPLFSQKACFYFGTLSADYCGQRQNTLYISFDPFFSPQIFGLKEKNMGITEGICLLKNKLENTNEQLKSKMLHAKNCDIYGGCVHWADCTEILEDEAVTLVRELIGNSFYKRVFIDFGGLYRMAGGLIKLCHKLYIPEPLSMYEHDRMSAFDRQAELMGINIKEQAEFIPFHSINMGDVYALINQESVVKEEINEVTSRGKLSDAIIKRRLGTEEDVEKDMLAVLKRSGLMNIVKAICVNTY